MAQKKIGIKDIAQMAGVAPSTVSHVLNGTASISDEVRERVLQVARDTGYLNRRRSKANIASLRKVLLAIPPDSLSGTNVNLVSWTILNALTQDADTRGIRVTVHTINPDATDAQVSDAARVGDMDGILLLNDDRPDLLKTINQSGIPAVLINGEDIESHIDSVTPSNRFAAQKATNRLIEMGHKRILHLTWRGRSTIQQRHDGFRDAFTDPSRKFHSNVIVQASGRTQSDGQEAMRDWLTLNPDLDGVTAIFCANDNLALGAMKALQAAGIRVPQDMSLMGFNGVGLGELQVPALSTVRIPLKEIGSAAFDLLDHRANSANPTRAPRRLELGCEIVERDSTAAPRTKAQKIGLDRTADLTAAE